MIKYVYVFMAARCFTESEVAPKAVYVIKLVVSLMLLHLSRSLLLYKQSTIVKFSLVAKRCFCCFCTSIKLNKKTELIYAILMRFLFDMFHIFLIWIVIFHMEFLIIELLSSTRYPLKMMKCNFIYNLYLEFLLQLSLIRKTL